MNDLNKIGAEAENDVVKARTEMIAFSTDYKVIQITNDYELKNQSDILKQLKQMIASLEERRKARVKPLNDYVSSINAEYKPIMERAEEIKRALSTNIIGYQTEQQRIAEEAHAKIVAEELRLIAEEEAKIAESGVTNDFVSTQEQRKILAEKKSEFSPSFRTGFGTTTIRKSWTYEVLKPNLVPRNLCSPDNAKIKAEIKSGARSIKGLRIYEESNLTSR